MLEPYQQKNTAGIDPTTGAMTRVALQSEEGLEALHKKLDGSPAACIMIDVASMGIANSVIGRKHVDEFLHDLVIHLEKEFPEGEVIRWGGDEFLIVMPLNDEITEKVLIERINALSKFDSPIAGLVLEHTTECRDGFSQAEILSAMRKHQKEVTSQFLRESEDTSPANFRTYCQQDIIHERHVSANVLTLYTGSWEYLGSNPSESSILESVKSSNQALSAAKTGKKSTQHFTGDVTDLSKEGLISGIDDIAADLSREKRTTSTDSILQLDPAISNSEKGQFVYRLSNIENEDSSQIIGSRFSNCLMINVDQFGAINNNFTPEIADEMLADIVDKIFTYYNEQSPSIFRSSGGELLVLLERQLSVEEINKLGLDLLSTVRSIVDPEDPQMQKMANAAVISSAVNNEIRYMLNLIKQEERDSTEGLGDIFISQVNSTSPTEGQRMGNYMGELKYLCHSNPNSRVFSSRDPSDHLLFSSCVI